MTDSTDQTARALDEEYPALRERFHLPGDGPYMDGNSLGAMPTAAARAVESAMAEWRELGIEAWTEADPPWFRYGEVIGERTAPLIGADPDEVVAANSTTVNIHTLVGTFYEPDDGRTKILVDALTFPTDTYAIRAQLRLRGFDPDDHLVVVESRDGRTIEEDGVIAAMDDDVALAFLPSALYRSGQLLDIERLARAANERGITFGLDLAHSIGAVPHDLGDSPVDFAVWCGYKYLNGGPGSIAGLYVDREHHGRTPALTGWWGHEKETQFELRDSYTPEPTAGAWQIGTVPVLSAAPLLGALSLYEELSIEAVRERSLRLTDYLIALVDEVLDEPFAVGTPREPARRGGHVAVEHPEAARLSRALRDRGVIVDYRPPNVVRICPAPLYTRFVEIHEVIETLDDLERTGAYESYDEPGDVT